MAHERHSRTSTESKVVIKQEIIANVPFEKAFEFKRSERHIEEIKITSLEVENNEQLTFIKTESNDINVTTDSQQAVDYTVPIVSNIKIEIEEKNIQRPSSSEDVFQKVDTVSDGVKCAKIFNNDTCITCNSPINDVMYIHALESGGLKKTLCFECTKNENEAVKLYLHRLEFTADDPPKRIHMFDCKVCKYTTRIKYRMKKHVDVVHKKVKDFKCNECSQTFAQGFYLKVHVDTVHNNIKKYPCTECDREFSLKSNLTKHVDYLHRKIKKFKCLECNYAFAAKCALMKHIRCVHTKFKKYICSECDTSFDQKNNLITHILDIHASI